MILRASAAFVKRFKCPAGDPALWSGHARGHHDWSCHFIRLGRDPVVAVMHDATLFVMIIPVAGVKSYEEFLRRFLDRVEKTWAAFGAAFDPANQAIILLPRSDRSRIGSMNDAIRGFRWPAPGSTDYVELEASANETPYRAIDYADPVRMMKALLK